MAGENPEFENPFSGFDDLDFNIDEGTTDSSKLLAISDEISQNESLAIADSHAGELAVRPSERESISTMSQEAIAAELTSYSMTENSLSVLSDETKSNLLEGLRKKQEISEYQTIGSMQQHGEILPPAVTKLSSELSSHNIEAELLTVPEAQKLSRFMEFRAEDTDKQLEILRDVITQSRNGVNSRRDYLDKNSPFYDPDMAIEQERILDEINDYLDNGGYANYENDPEAVSQEERDRLVDEYGDDPYFLHATRSELIDLGYLEEEDKALGPLTESDLGIIEDLARPSYSDLISSRSKEVVGQISPFSKLNPQVKNNGNLTDLMTNRFIETEISAERTLDAKTLIGGFIALEKDFIESGMTKEVKEYLKENPNDNIQNTLRDLRRRFMHGGRICNLLCNGSDKQAREKYGTMVPVKPEFFNDILAKSEAFTDLDNKRKRETRYEFLIKLDDSFDRVRIAYSALDTLIHGQKEKTGAEMPSGTFLSANESTPITPEVIEESKPAMSNEAVKKIIDVTRIFYGNEPTSESDIEIPANINES